MSSIIAEKQQHGQDSLLNSYRDRLYYKQNKVFEKEHSIELLLYTDEFECGNHLGSKKGKHKLLGIYMSVLSLPKKYHGKLDHILLVALAKSSLVNKYGLDAILAPITRDLEDLHRNGLQMNCAEFSGIVHPLLFQVIGDNLAVNTTLGFVGSFSPNYFCRKSKSLKTCTHLQTVEDERTLQTKDNIERDMEASDVTNTGVHRSCKLNKLVYYHMADN